MSTNKFQFRRFHNIHFVQTQSAVIPNGVCKIKLERQLHPYASTKYNKKVQVGKDQEKGANKLDRDNSKLVRNLYAIYCE